MSDQTVLDKQLSTVRVNQRCWKQFHPIYVRKKNRGVGLDPWDLDSQAPLRSRLSHALAPVPYDLRWDPLAVADGVSVLHVPPNSWYSTSLRTAGTPCPSEQLVLHVPQKVSRMADTGICDNMYTRSAKQSAKLINKLLHQNGIGCIQESIYMGNQARSKQQGPAA